MTASKKVRFRIEGLEDRLAPSGVVLGFNAHHDTVVTNGDGGSVVLGANAHHDTIVVNSGETVVLGFNAHHDTIVVNDGGQVILGANAHQNTIVTGTGRGSCCCDPKTQPCC